MTKIMIISVGAQDTSGYRISSHSSQAFSRKCSENPNVTHFANSKLRQKYENEQTVIRIESFLEMVMIHQHTEFRAIFSLCLPANVWKPQIDWTPLLNKNYTKIRNQHTVTKTESFLGVARIHTTLQAILSMRSSQNAWKPQICPISRSQKFAKSKNINILWPKSTTFWGWSGLISTSNSSLFFPCVLQKIPGNPKCEPFY